MGFSARQVHCLERMGLVPWIGTGASASASASAQTVSASLPLMPSDTQPDTMAVPAIADLAQWLPEQALRQFLYRGTEQCVSGAPTASLVVIVQAHDSLDRQAPLGDEPAQLFDLILRSIGLSRSDCRLASVAINGSVQTSDANPQTVAELCLAPTRAVLALVLDWDHSDLTNDAAQHGARIGAQQLPLWRIPHPELLLQHTTLKRQAWQVLKALRADLAGG